MGKQHYQKRVFLSVIELLTYQTLKKYGETKLYQKRALLVVLRLLVTMQIILYWETK